jgi:hypothetical protein
MNMGPGFFPGEEEKPKTGFSEYCWTHTDVVTEMYDAECKGRWMKLVRKCLTLAVQNQVQPPSIE